MKKVLLATTALAMTAGMAAADVSLSGYAEIGVADRGDGDVVFHHDFDVKFTLSGATDNGLTFGATIDLDEVSNGIDADANPASVFLSGDFGTVTMGDTDGAFDWALSEIAWGTAINDDHTIHGGWNGNSGLDGGLDGQVARYEYSFGDFAIALSGEIGNANEDRDEVLGIGGKYSGDFGGWTFGVGIGYQTGAYASPFAIDSDGVTIGATTDIVALQGNGNADIYGISLSGDWDNGFGIRFNYSHLDGDLDSLTGFTGAAVDTARATGNPAVAVGSLVGEASIDWDHYGIGVAYAWDEWLIEANYGQYEGNIGDLEIDSDGWGLAINYDLGGGAVVMVGYGSGGGFVTQDQIDQGSLVAGEDDTWSAGLGLSF